MALFREALERGVHLNLYLDNNIISKLSKARKADHALELFQQMKASGLAPSSITYGAVIGACARVDDVNSAEILFQEMIHSTISNPEFLRITPLMQLYTATKLSRTSALHYYNEMIQAGVKPSSHTYKVQSVSPILSTCLILFLASCCSIFTVSSNPLTSKHGKCLPRTSRRHPCRTDWSTLFLSH